MTFRNLSPSVALRTVLALLVSCSSAHGAEPILTEQDEAFLREQAVRVVASARLPPGERKGKWENLTPYVVHVPGGNMGYPAFWVRDAVMMLGADLVSVKDLEDWVRLICSTLRAHDWIVRPGVVVPAYAVPDHINFDGKPTFYPGNYETGSKQGGKPWGKYPPLDDHFYFIDAVYEHWRLSGNARLLSSTVKTADGEANLLELCERVYRVASVDQKTGLCIAGDVETENAKDFGFCDSVSKSGKLLFPSILRFKAAQGLAEIFGALHQTAKAQAYKKDASAIQQAIAPVFFHASEAYREGWLHSSTGVGNQPDVWGSAFAVYSGAVDSLTAQKVAKALVRAYREGTAVREGCIRHILLNDPKNLKGWQMTVSPAGEYQNGGYWGTPSGWYIAAVQTVDRDAALAMSQDYIQFLRRYTRPDGASEAWEWFNPETGRRVNPMYAATVALPYASLKQAGLLRHNQ